MTYTFSLVLMAIHYLYIAPFLSSLWGVLSISGELIRSLNKPLCTVGHSRGGAELSPGHHEPDAAVPTRLHRSGTNIM